MSRKTKFTERAIETILRLIQAGHAITNACRGACISTDTFYRWLAKYPDFNKAVVEAINL